MTNLPEGAVRKRKVPDFLVGKSVRLDDVRAWARNELGGQEPLLDDEDCKQIRSGTLKEVTLRPRKAGFYTPSGEFVEAFDTALSFGDDLEEREVEWDKIEEDRRWADEENTRFNKTQFERSPKKTRMMWEHGRRIIAYAERNGRPYSAMLKLLDRRRPVDGYARHTHQTCLDLYWWIEKEPEDSAIFSWSWERIDSILRFSNKPNVRDLVKQLQLTTELASVNDEDFSRCLGVKTRAKDRALLPVEMHELEEFRSQLKNAQFPTREQISRCIRIVSQIHQG